jgi:hypothetical protein
MIIFGIAAGQNMIATEKDGHYYDVFIYQPDKKIIPLDTVLGIPLNSQTPVDVKWHIKVTPESIPDSVSTAYITAVKELNENRIKVQDAQDVEKIQ